ncbi:DUF3265 domain-containing protein [Shewanella avicenniae]|uniref:DUF3265 domain-containing protein n=1 Tax=Shewanella avicenniae TaxID=2814294 RepID=A0ABX7QMB8_9GAMM|nr:DUF3265 domain-containing protein [Shewanella avicenniae]
MLSNGDLPTEDFHLISSCPCWAYTNGLRGIRNAWHFYYALILVIKVVCSGFGIALLTS